MLNTEAIEYIVRGDMPDLEQIRENCHRQVSLSKRTNIKNAKFIRPQGRLRLRTAAAIIAVVVLITTTAFAAWYFLTPGEVAREFGNQALSAAFESETAVNINETITSGDYTFTLLAVVTGRDITDMPYYSADVQLDRTYAVVAIANADGTPMQDDSGERAAFFTSPLVQGLNPLLYNVTTMGGRYSDAVIDGVLYRIVECDGVAIFADRGLCFAVSTIPAGDNPVAYNANAFIFDEQTGITVPNPGFAGSCAIFDLPIDASLADPEKAALYLAADPENRDKDATVVPAEIIYLPISEIDEAARDFALLFYDAVMLHTGEDISGYPISADYDQHTIPNTNEEVALWIFRVTDGIYDYYGEIDMNMDDKMVTTLLVTDISASLSGPVQEHTYDSAHEEAARRVMDKVESDYDISYWGHGSVGQNSVVSFIAEKDGITYLISVDKDSYRFVAFYCYPNIRDATRG